LELEEAIFCSVADTANNAEKVQANCRFGVPQLLFQHIKELGAVCHGSCQRWRQTQKLLQRLQEVFERGRLTAGKCCTDCGDEVLILEKVILNPCSLFLK